MNYDAFNDQQQHQESAKDAEEIHNHQQQQQQQSNIADYYQQSIALHEIFLLQKTEIIVVLELEEVPVVLLKSTIEATMYDWSSLLNSTFELSIQGNYFNENLQQWEPFIDPVVIDDNEYKPWEVMIKIFQDKSMPMLTTSNESNKSKKKGRNALSSTKHAYDEDDRISEDEMVFLEPSNTFLTRNTRIKTSLSTFLEDTDSENEDGTMEKLAAAISDLFTGYLFLAFPQGLKQFLNYDYF